jgi:hypothetical protein
VCLELDSLLCPIQRTDGDPIDSSPKPGTEFVIVAAIRVRCRSRHSAMAFGQAPFAACVAFTRQDRFRFSLDILVVVGFSAFLFFKWISTRYFEFRTESEQ